MPRLPKKSVRIVLITSGILLLFITGFTLFCNWQIRSTSTDYLYNSVEEIPHNSVALLLGTSQYISDGVENPYFSHRIKATIELYEAGKIDCIIVSGDNSLEEYNEPRAMFLALVEGGIPPENIQMDFAGFRTLDSVIRCKKVFQQDKITIVSQEFHNQRAVYIARQNGIEAIGFNARDLSASIGKKTHIREYFAKVKAFIDVNIIHKDPKFLGEKIEVCSE